LYGAAPAVPATMNSSASNIGLTALSPGVNTRTTDADGSCPGARGQGKGVFFRGSADAL
jgi:hypothetical protein